MSLSIRLIVSFVALVAFSAEAADVSGNWSAKIVTAAGQRDYTFVFRQNGGRLIGSLPVIALEPSKAHAAACCDA